MVEFALAIPFLLLALFAIIYFGRAFLVKQAIAYAAQEGARALARVPNLKDPQTRDYVRGFTLGGQGINPDSVIYSALGAARLLSAGVTGNLPANGKVKILPWDGDGSAADYTPPGTIAVRIEYPFQLLGNAFSGEGDAPELKIAIEPEDPGNPVIFKNLTISERATVSQEIYQEVN